MALAGTVLMELLGREYPVLSREVDLSSWRIQRIQLWDGQTPVEDVLYLAKAANPSGQFLTIVERESDCIGEGVFLITGENGVFQGINRVFAIFQDFLTWQNACAILAEAEHDLPALLHHGANYLQASLILIDHAYKNQANALYPGMFPSPDAFFEQDMTLEDVENLYHVDPQFDDTFLTRGLHSYSINAPQGYGVYYYNFFYESLYLGRLLLLVKMGQDTPGFLTLADLFCRYVEICYRHSYLRKMESDSDHSYEILRKLLNNESVMQQEIAPVLHRRGWEPQHQYRIILMVPNGYVYSEQSLKYFAVQFEDVFPNCIVAVMDEKLYCLQNLDVEKQADFRQQFATFLRENLFKSGVSKAFRNVFHCYRYRQQAQDALRLGQKRDPSLWRYDFSDYLYDYIKGQCLKAYPARDLCPNGLEKLLQYDEQNPEGDLVRTLEVYYQCRFNAAEAAKQLYIHRTTLFYRLNKIKQIASVDFDNPEENLLYQLGLSLLRQEHMNMKNDP